MRDEERDRQLAIATTILAQLGGDRFAAMTGAKNFIFWDRGLKFNLPKKPHYAKNAISIVTIALTESDTYRIRFYRTVGRYLTETVKDIEGIYHDQLRDIFTAETGLRTSL